MITGLMKYPTGIWTNSHPGHVLFRVGDVILFEGERHVVVKVTQCNAVLQSLAGPVMVKAQTRFGKEFTVPQKRQFVRVCNLVEPGDILERNHRV